MKLVTITVPLDKSISVVSYMQNELNFNSIKLITGDNCSQIQIYISQSTVALLLYKLDKIGCGVSYGQIAISNIDTIKPLPKITNNLSFSRYEKISSEEIYSNISSGCVLTYDYIAYVIVSSLIAGIGLATNNSVQIVASMLLSPLMGPILGFCLGSIIQDSNLFWRGIKNEIIGVFIAFMVGFLIGIGYFKFADNFDWPTEQMTSRGETLALTTGLAFAIPAGIGVGISVTVGGINNLVGVAIAASLLPPIVNMGICFSYGLITSQFEYDIEQEEYLTYAGYSGLLFLMNVVIIYLESILVFRFKGVRPFRRQSVMWSEIPKINFPENENNNILNIDDSINSSIDELTEKEIQNILQEKIRAKHLIKIIIRKYINHYRIKKINKIMENNKDKINKIKILISHIKNKINKNK